MHFSHSKHLRLPLTAVLPVWKKWTQNALLILHIKERNWKSMNWALPPSRFRAVISHITRQHSFFIFDLTSGVSTKEKSPKLDWKPFSKTFSLTVESENLPYIRTFGTQSHFQRQKPKSWATGQNGNIVININRNHWDKMPLKSLVRFGVSVFS